MTDRSKYLHRPQPGTLLFRYRHQTIGRLPIDEGSAEFAAAYDALLAEALAGKHGAKPGKAGRPLGMLKPKPVRVPVPVVDGRKLYRPPMMGWVIDRWLASDWFYPAARAVPNRTYRGSTQRGYRYALAIMRDAPVVEGLDAPFGEIAITKLSPRVVRHYIEAVRRKYGASTAGAHRKLLKLLWKFARNTLPQVNIDNLANPVPDVDDPYRVVRPHQPWPLDIQEQFKARCNEDYLLIFLMCLNTGQRISDVQSMLWSQFDGTHLNVEASIKTGVPARRRVPADLLALLQKRKREATAVTIVTSRCGTPFRAGSVWAGFKRILTEIGAADYTTHGLRKTAAQLLADEGASIEEIMVLGGWKTEAMARYYVNLAGAKQIAVRADDRMDAALQRQAAAAAERRRAGLFVVGGGK